MAYGLYGYDNFYNVVTWVLLWQGMELQRDKKS